VTNPLPKFRFTFWKLVLLVFLAAGAYSTWIRFRYGLGASTNLSDQFPWGLWVGFDVLCGVMLAAGGFTLTAAVHIFNIKKLHPIVRPTVLTAFLGYILVSVALLFDLGRPYRIWHPLIMRNPHSVMFEVAMCVMLYTTVLSLEFAPIVLEHFKLHKPLAILSKISIVIVIFGVILSTLHQSSLGTVYLIMPNKLHPFWYSPILPAFFFLSAIAVGLAMTIFESSMSSKYFGRALELSILQTLGRVLVVVLAVYSILRFEDLYHRHMLAQIFVNGYEQRLFWVEAFLILCPLVLLMIKKVRMSPQGLYLSAVMVVLGFIANRLNVSITGIEWSAGLHYIPKWTELAITGAIIAVGFALFGLAAKYLPIFPEEHEVTEHTVPADAPVVASAMAHAGD
jgi:Ni/Fe-hydrogenase subunit HybB-like protein